MQKFISLFILLLGFTTVQAQDDAVTQNTIKGVFSRNQDQIVSLAEAFSEEQYAWRPAEGVRSVGESLLHVAQANYFFMMKLGFELPEDVDMMTLPAITGKDNIVSAVRSSFEFAGSKIADVETAKFTDEVEMPFGKLTVLSSLLVMMEHSGEHKGQLIAYARSNGIVPPWSE